MPIFNKFDPKNLRGDLTGGLTAAVVALPLAIAFGVSSGLGPSAGVYGAILVGFFATMFGGTPAQISGPTGPMTVVMTGIVIEYLAADPTHGLTGAFTIIVMAGLFQIGFGLLRLGKYVIQVSYPVISGFMSGIGVIIILIQIGPLLGLAPSAGPSQALHDIPVLLSTLDVPSAVLGMSAVLLAFLWPARLNTYLPVPLLLVLAGTLAVIFLPFFEGVTTIAPIAAELPRLSLPEFNPMLFADELSRALVIAALGSIDSLLTSLVADNITGTQHNSDKELIGQGIGNTLAGLFGALPGAGATVRTVVNVKSGGSSATAGVTHSLLMLAVILGAGNLAAHIPHTILAAVLIKVGIDIIDRRFIKRIHRIPLLSSGVMLLVLGLTIFVDLITAVFVGVFISNMVTVDRLTSVQLDNVMLFGNDDPELEPYRREGETIIMLELNGPMSFGVGRGISRRLAEMGEHDTLMINLKNAHLLGITSAMVVEDIVEDEQSRNHRVMINRELEGAAFRNLARLGVFDRVRDQDRF
jgi:SulP family sulfate permease